MGEQYNAYCSICGKPYHLCKSCSEVKSFLPWRTVTDTLGHYLIYSAIHGYTTSKNKLKAMDELNKCDLSEIETFNPEIRQIINEILKSDKIQKDADTSSSTSKNKKRTITNTIMNSDLE